MRYLGAGHGFAGNVFPALRGAHMLSADLVAAYAQRTEETLRATALRDAGLANWPPQLLPPGESPPRSWCRTVTARPASSADCRTTWFPRLMTCC